MRFDSFGSPVWETLECSDSALKALTAAALDGLSCVQRALVVPNSSFKFTYG